MLGFTYLSYVFGLVCSQAIAGHAKELGLRPHIFTNRKVDRLVRSFCALALLPVKLLWKGLEVLAIRARREGVFLFLEPLFYYIKNTWYSYTNLRMLSVYNCPHRTNNVCESCNAAMVAAMKQKRPNIWSFQCKYCTQNKIKYNELLCMLIVFVLLCISPIDALVNLDDIYKYNLNVVEDGLTATRARGTAALANDEAIEGYPADLVEENMDIDEFLEKASHRLKGVYNNILDSEPEFG